MMEGLSAHRCQLCHGVFIPGGFFREVKAQAALQVHREIAGYTPNLNASPRLCPKRCTTMMLMQIKGIEIDVCPHCDGIWLDSGELEKMILHFQNMTFVSNNIHSVFHFLLDEAKSF